MLSILNKVILSAISLLPKKMVYIFAGRYVAGSNMDSAIEATRIVNELGYSATLDILGEHTKTIEESNQISEDYIQLYQKIKKHKLDSNISIKPSHIGLDISYELCLKNLLSISHKAIETNNFLRIDMESSKHTDDTINLLNDSFKEFQNTGTVFQAYLHRTLDDIINLNYKNINYRLCKGIYKEPSDISIHDRAKINDNYLKILEQGFKLGHYIGIATHDIELLQRIYDLIDRMNIDKNQFEFQVLYGVPMHGWLRKHTQNGYKVRVYIPFGPDWYDYSIRRLKENPNIMWYVIKNLFK
tara:strand:+ start:214 stop:1113 length:900 start_codon:yes stop_codon:yes gene_type:complete